jgi:thiol-disulfide isomerase/thioredoxin
VFVPLLLVAGLASARSNSAELEARLAALEAKVAELERELAAARQEVPQKLDAAAEAAAADLLTQVKDAIEAHRFDDAKALLASLLADYPRTRAASYAQRLDRELSIIGTRLPADWASHIDEWYLREPRFHMDRGLVVALYWETWCPHCKREIPKWATIAQQYGPDGLQVVGLTKLSRSSTPEAVQSFIAEHHIGFPVGKEDGQLTTAAGVSGVPAAAVYRDGVVIWRGHPATIDDALIQQWLAER